MSIEELQAVQENEHQIIQLNGKERKIKFGMRAWAKIEEAHPKDMVEFFNAVITKPFESLPELIYFGVIREEGEIFTIEDVWDWLDEYTILVIKSILEKVKTAFIGSSPIPKEKTTNPKKAK